MNIFQSLRDWFRRDAELTEELESHLKMAAADRVAQGESAEDARKSALREFGNLPLIADITREQRGAIWLDSLAADVSFGWRQLCKRKMTTLAAVVSLGLAIGSCTAAFRLVDALFLRPMPAVSDPSSLYAVTYSRQATAYLPASFDTNSYPFFEHARDLVNGEAEIAAASTMSHIDVTFGTDAETEKAYRQSVSGDLFSMLGLKPALGRLLTEDDDRVVSGSPYAVISYDYWQARFERDPKVIGRNFRMRDQMYEIVGVGPKGFTGTEPGTITDIFVPAKMEPGLLYANSFAMRLFVRVGRGVQLRALAEKLNAAYQHWEDVRLKDFPRNLLSANATLSLKPAGTGASLMQSEYALALTVLGVLVALVLLIACMNVANLMAGQAAARTHELAVRTSLGAGRTRLARLVMLESAILGSLSAALGLVFTWWATPYVVSQVKPSDDPAQLVLNLDWRIAAFAMLLTLAVTTLFGLTPALRASGVRPLSALKGEEPRRKATRMQTMIALQIAFCFVVLFLGGLFVVTETKLAERTTGFVAERVLLLDTVANAEQPAVKWDQLAAALSNVQGVQQAALEDWPLMSGTQHNDRISVHGQPPSPTLAFFLAVSPGWLDTMRIPLLDGRDFRDTDATPSVALVNETFVKAYFGGRSPVGQFFEVAKPLNAPMSQPNARYQVVGVVKDVMYRNVREQILPQVYLPVHRQLTAAGAVAGTLQKMRGEVIVVRTSSDDVERIAELLRHTVTQIDSEFRVSTVTTQTELISDQTIRERLLARLAGFFSGVALLLAAVGLYGVLHYSVVQREREIGIRIALGATGGNIARIVSVRVLVMVLAGAGFGLAAGMASVHFVRSLLYGVRGTEISMMAVPVIVLLTASACAGLPAVLRALRIDPATMLRAD
jgi:putative ABC transport system permease protein